MNNLRLGFTESTLLFFFYLDSLDIDNTMYIDKQNELCNWLYSTSGFYDKHIKGSYFDFDPIQIKKSQTYNEYFNKLLNILKNNNNFHLELCFHNIHDSLLIYKENFLNYIHYYDKQSKPDFYIFLNNKNILIINNLGSLMKKQYDSGNMKKINTNFPDQVKSIQYFENGYTFFNNGPNQNILEATKILCNKINNFIFDAAVISAGAYSCLIADYIVTHLKKDVFVCGGSLPLYFGISTLRVKKFHKDQINEYFIVVPSELKPEGYLKIEDGAYW